MVAGGTDERRESKDTYTYVLNMVDTEWARSLAFSKAIIPIYVEVLLLILFRDHIESSNYLILSLGMLNIGLVFLFNLKGSIHAITSSGYILLGYHFENIMKISNGFCHVYIERNKAFIERHFFSGKKPKSVYFAFWKAFKSPFFSARLSSVVLTTGLSSLQVGLIITVMFRISGYLDQCTWPDLGWGVFWILFGIVFYFIIIWQITSMYWRAVEIYYFDILMKIFPEFYSTNHPLYQEVKSEQELMNGYRELLANPEGLWESERKKKRKKRKRKKTRPRVLSPKP